MSDAAVELEAVGPVSDEQLGAMVVERARLEGLQLTGQGGLLQQRSRLHRRSDPPLHGQSSARAPLSWKRR